MKIGGIPFVKTQVMAELHQRYKEGYCSIESMVTFLRNDYRELTIEQAVKVINEWIDEYKIKQEHLAIAYNRVKQQKVVVTKSTLDKIRANKR